MASIYDVAQRAGVSISTVSRVLNGTAGVRPEKEAAVRRAIEALHYVPNTMAHALATQTSGFIGITNIFNVDSTYTIQLLQGFMQYLDGTPHSAVLINEGTRSGESWLAPVCMEYIDRRRIDALFCLSAQQPDENDGDYQRIVRENFPLAYLGPRPEGEGHPTNIFTVYAQMDQYVFDVLGRFAQKGHRRVGLFYHRREQARRFAATAKRAGDAFGIQTGLYHVGHEGTTTLEDAVDSLLRAGSTALFTDALVDMGRLLQLLDARSVTVPGQLSLCSVEHKPGEGESFGPGLDCVHVPAFEMGLAGARLLASFLRGQPTDDTHVDLASRYITRCSVQAI